MLAPVRVRVETRRIGAVSPHSYRRNSPDMCARSLKFAIRKRWRRCVSRRLERKRKRALRAQIHFLSAAVRRWARARAAGERRGKCFSRNSGATRRQPGKTIARIYDSINETARTSESICVSSVRGSRPGIPERVGFQVSRLASGGN